MKRSIFAASLLLTPALLHAQAASPAQTLQAHVAPIAAVNAASSAAASAASAKTPIRVSTGVVGPKLIQFVGLAADNLATRVTAQELKVVVDLVVDETGKPTNLAISQSAGDLLDHEVLSSVSQYRFKPGTLDGQPYTLPVKLQVIIEPGARY